MRGQFGHESSIKSPILIYFAYLYFATCYLLTAVGTSGVPQSAHLKRETENLFYHGFENYMKHSFPEDELRPLSCKPLTRDPQDPAHFELNDVLGNYSLTLVDSLSTLAILASSPSESGTNNALLLFQDGVQELVMQYGDGTDTHNGLGYRSRGFALDSKVQVFETAIRGLGGLLSAHLFAVGDLPINDYSPPSDQAMFARAWKDLAFVDNGTGIRWQNGFIYNGQLLRLAYDLGQRLIPAFWTPSGIPYPRVNLRDGIPFYANSPRNYNPVDGQCESEAKELFEITETCSAGAGSLVLEFTVLSRLTGDSRFEELAKRAFWAIWDRRSEIDLIGAGIDAETGAWVHTYTGIGAGIDSFFEYAFKSFILLSNDFHPKYKDKRYDHDPRLLFEPLSPSQHRPENFLKVWEKSHNAIKRHLLRGTNYQHPHYIQGDLNTGAARAFWVDALSAYYPGLLTISGNVEEAVESHLLSTALWSRFSALPERWNLITGGIEGGLGWWVGRPEFIESNYYLYRATEDPWYQYVGEMVLKDIKRRCWTQCGWTGIQNVLTGEKSDRMESFFLGETAKYLFLLFDNDHPLNRMDAPFVFSTEGHPLIIPRSVGNNDSPWKREKSEAVSGTCPAKLPDLPITVSRTAARIDVYHAGSLARLHLMPQQGETQGLQGEHAADHPSITNSGLTSPSNFTHFPWTLPPELIPFDAISGKMPTRPTFDISFPNIANEGQSAPPIQRVKDGILINFLGGLRLSMIQDAPFWLNDEGYEGYRIQAINSVALGKDEKVFLARETGMKLLSPSDPNFTRVEDSAELDLIVDSATSPSAMEASNVSTGDFRVDSGSLDQTVPSPIKAAWSSLVSQIASLVQDTSEQPPQYGTRSLAGASGFALERLSIPAMAPTGIGAAPIPDWPDAMLNKVGGSNLSPLLWKTVYATGNLCDQRLPQSVPRLNQVIVVTRGGCSFSQKLSNIPLFTPSTSSLQLVVIVNFDTKEDGDDKSVLFRPLLDEVQVTSSGLPRQNLLPMVMIGGGHKSYDTLRKSQGIGVRRHYSIRSQGVPITNLVVV